MNISFQFYGRTSYSTTTGFNFKAEFKTNLSYKAQVVVVTYEIQQFD